MVAKTDFNIIILPAVERNLEDQLQARCRILSTIRVNKSYFFLPNSSGSPRYLPKPPSFSIPNWSFILSLMVVGVLGENVSADFSGLIICPDASSYFFNISKRASQFCLSDLQKEGGWSGGFSFPLWCLCVYFLVVLCCRDQTRLLYKGWRDKGKADLPVLCLFVG